MKRVYAERPEYRVSQKAWREANPEKIAASAAKHMVTRWVEHLVWNARRTTRSRAKNGRVHAVEITADDVRTLFEKQGGRCYWLGIPLVPSAEKRDPFRPSLDRLDCAKGYVEGNVVLACLMVNVGRGDCDAALFRERIESMKIAIRDGA